MGGFGFGFGSGFVSRWEITLYLVLTELTAVGEKKREIQGRPVDVTDASIWICLYFYMWGFVEWKKIYLLSYLEFGRDTEACMEYGDEYERSLGRNVLGATIYRNELRGFHDLSSGPNGRTCSLAVIAMFFGGMT